MSKSFSKITGAAAPLLLPNIDTDTIAPGQLKFHKAGERDFSEKGSGDSAMLFGNWRYDEKGNEEPDFVLNQPPFREAKILLTGDNFGCGSSRETAVWYLELFGLTCVIAPSFGEIFYNNCFKNGVLPIVMTEAQIADLVNEAQPGAPDAMFTVDLTINEITTPPGNKVAFTVPDFRRQQLLEGEDEIGLNLRRADEVAAYLENAKAERPWGYP